MDKKFNFFIALLLILAGYMFYFVWNDSLDTQISQKDSDEKNFTLDKKKVIPKKEIVQSTPIKTYQRIDVKKKQQSSLIEEQNFTTLSIKEEKEQIEATYCKLEPKSFYDDVQEAEIYFNKIDSESDEITQNLANEMNDIEGEAQ